MVELRNGLRSQLDYLKSMVDDAKVTMCRPPSEPFFDRRKSDRRKKDRRTRQMARAV